MPPVVGVLYGAFWRPLAREALGGDVTAVFVTAPLTFTRHLYGSIIKAAAIHSELLLLVAAGLIILRLEICSHPVLISLFLHSKESNLVKGLSLAEGHGLIQTSSESSLLTCPVWLWTLKT